MVKQWINASGYSAIFLMPALLFAGTLWGKPWLAFGVVVLVLPMLRLVFGAMPATAPEWSEEVATFLDRLPLVYPPMFAASALASLWAMDATGRVADRLDWLWAQPLDDRAVRHLRRARTHSPPRSHPGHGGPCAGRDMRLPDVGRRASGTSRPAR